MSGSLLAQLNGVSKSYLTRGGRAVPVLQGVDLAIHAGEQISLVGPSGCGKSTLLALIAGLLTPDAGSVVIDGAPMDTLDDTTRSRLRADRLGVALQSDNLIPFLSARENVELAMCFGTHRQRRPRNRAMELLERFGVSHRADHRPRQLSGGEAQRVALAVALACDPALLLADEVVAQLDAETAGQVLDEILGGDQAVLYVTHDLDLADRVPVRYRFHDQRIELR